MLAGCKHSLLQHKIAVCCGVSLAVRAQCELASKLEVEANKGGEATFPSRIRLESSPDPLDP